MKAFVLSHVTLVTIYLVVTPGSVRVMGAGVVVMLCVEEVNTSCVIHISSTSIEEEY